MTALPDIHLAHSLTGAVDALAERGPEGAAFAGGTWIMRAPLRQEAFHSAYVALSRIPEMQRIEIGEKTVEIGAVVTHAGLATALAGLPGFAALTTAAGMSANPAVRAAATVGGNIMATGFPAADLVPALLALGADIEISTKGGSERIGLEAFLQSGSAMDRHSSLGNGWLLSRIVLPRSPARSAHARLPLRQAGDYPVAVVSICTTLDAAGGIDGVRVAVGSVGERPRRWASLEAALIGLPLDPDWIAKLAEERLGDFTGRDGIEAPGWYRVRVLPALVRRAVQSLIATA